MAVASATLLGLWGSHATALSLGNIKVQSALGEPLRAEIDILEINAEEASSLRTRVALPDDFRAAGLEYSPALSGMQITMQKRPDGRSYLRLSNVRPINDPYLDLVLDASWSSGRIVRDYTMLFDPPKLSPSQPITPQVPQASSVPVRIEPQPLPPMTEPQAAPAVAMPQAPMTPAEAAPPPSSEMPAPPAADMAPAPAMTADAPPTLEAGSEPPVAGVETQPVTIPMAKATPAPDAAPQTTAALPPRQLTVKAGDTAGRIALSLKPIDVSLDQMLVAMLRSNPEAFIDGNVNRIRAGSVVSAPGDDDARAIPSEEARQIVVAQSRDFNEFRRRLASTAPASTEAAADRKTSGTVQAKVEEKKPAQTTPDKLTLSKGSVEEKSTADKIAAERTAKEAATRAEQMSKNIAELDKLSKAATPAPASTPPATTPAATAPAAPAPKPMAPAPEPAAAPAAAVAQAPSPAPTSVTVPTPAPVATAPAPQTPPAPRPAAPAPAPLPEEPSLIDELLDNPLIPAAGGGLVALLAGLAFYRSRQRKQSGQVDSSYLESKLQPDSFFGASGGQRVDTNDNGASSSSSSMVYSPSQLDAGDDVDPVAEADVYLAYGRDLQAEEILKEALRNHPSRAAIHQKLLEIYAKRRDAKSFNTIAKEAYKVTAGSGPEWDSIAEMGRSVDADNALYHPGGVPSNSGPAPLQAEAAEPRAASPARSPAPPPAAAARPAAAAAPAAAPASVDLDLDLDFSLDETPSRSGAMAPSAPTMPAPMSASMDNAMDFDAQPLPSLPTASAAPAKAPAADNSMNFDMGALSLDLGAPSEQPAGSPQNPLETKLALADEFKAIGDTDGARALIEEIISESSGEMKAQAQKALAALG